MTTTSQKPVILIIDDEPESVRNDAILGFAGRASTEALHPADVTLGNLEKADLVLVDYRLEYWPERDSQQCIGMKPKTGMALAAILREYADQSPRVQLTAFALHSGHLDDVRGRLLSGSMQHVIARLNNLEWVFPKDETRRYEQMIILAEGVYRLPRKWPDKEDESTCKLKSLLGMKEDALWFGRCWREVQECQPPIHELRDGGHGVLLIRWLLHQVMPYPTFLWEEHWVAARLRIPVETFRAAIGEDSKFAEDLKSMCYSGILAGFLGHRWWRGALEDYVWDLVGGQTGDVVRLRDALRERSGRDLGSLEPNPPVVCLDSVLQPTGQFESPSNALRLRPDHWPAFADAAWINMKTVLGDPILMAMVDPLDQDRLPDEGED